MTTSSRIRLSPGKSRVDCLAELLALNADLRAAAPRPVDRTATHSVRAASVVFFLILVSSFWCYAADVVLIRSAGGASPEQRELELATQFYGVNLKVITA